MKAALAGWPIQSLDTRACGHNPSGVRWLAAGLLVLVALVALPAHVHAGERGAEACAMCVARSGDVARSETPEVAPALFGRAEAPADPDAPPVTGAPLGAVPGQSPPAA